VAALGCTGAELVALGVLVTGALAALGLLWVAARPGAPLDPRPTAAPIGTPGVAVTAEEVVVHVAGAVASPGLYRLPGGARVADALAAAGGPLGDAALERLNLARALADGEQLLVPTQAEVAAGAAVGGGAGAGNGVGDGAPSNAGPGAAVAPGAPSAVRPDGTLDLNLATAADLDTLPGIGPVLAQRIIDHRDAAGGFATVGDLRDVPGIGEKRFQELSQLVAV
jgi:competence protein ComEA